MSNRLNSIVWLHKSKIVAASDVTNIYGNRPSNTEYVTVNHRGYVFAQQAGEYTFTIPSSDDITLLWVGPTAYSGWSRANAKIIQPFVSSGATPISYKETFTAGQYIPIRIMWAIGGGPRQFSLELKAPDGTVIIGGKDAKGSLFLVQYSCDRTSAPRYPPFGSET